MPDSRWTTLAPLRTRTRGALRFDRVAITSVFGPPDDPRTWSGAPHNLAAALCRLGIAVEFIHPSLGAMQRLWLAIRHHRAGYGRLSTGEQLMRSRSARMALSLQVAEETARIGIRHVLHTGTLDLPAGDLLPGIKHYLYCDQTWALSLRHRTDIDHYTSRAIAAFEHSEAEALHGLEHIFTFADCVRENMLDHYGLAPARVSTVGSGMGRIEPNFAAKSYAPPRLLFVAKHLFAAKGGPLVVDAFRLAHARRPDLSLTIVADPASRRLVPHHPSITFRSRLPWPALQALYHDATLLVQPMLNDPWGQVYLEALVSRTPVLGLARNGLPEIAGGGRYGFLVDRPDTQSIAAAIIDAVAVPDLLSDMGEAGQAHVLATYGWDRVAADIGFVSHERNEIHVP